MTSSEEVRTHSPGLLDVRKMAVDSSSVGESPVGRQGTKSRLAGLVKNPKGSNGGVRRGPDRFPRKHVARAQYLGALARTVGPVLDARGQVVLDEQGYPKLAPVDPGLGVLLGAGPS